MLVIFLVVPNGIAFYLWQQGARDNRLAELVDGPSPGAFSAEEPFVAEGVLKSPSGQSLKSLHFEEDCLAFRTEIRLWNTITNSDGELEDRSRVLMEQKRQVDDLRVEFAERSTSLQVEELKRFFGSRFEELNSLPEYVPDEKLPKKKFKKFWFDVSEAVFRSGQLVTVVAKVDGTGILDSHPAAAELIVYPGSRQECAQALDEAGQSSKLFAGILIAISLFGGILLAVILRFMKD